MLRLWQVDVCKHDVCKRGGTTALPLLGKGNANLGEEAPQQKQMTVTTHLSLLGAEGKAVARDFIVWLLKSGVKPTIFKRRPLVGERHGALWHLEFFGI